jgi:hypothetical protein
VQEDHLGVTVFRDDPKPKFVRMNAKGLISSSAQALVDDLSVSIGRYKFTSEKAEVAAGIYAIGHFIIRAPARFLLLFVSLETLFEPVPRSQEAQKHVQSLIMTTQRAQIAADDRDGIASALAFLKFKSIAQTGCDLAARLLSGQMYEGLDAAIFFSKIYNLRNNIVHKGKIDPTTIHSMLGEMDRFVSDVICQHYIVH